jgi:hypothetical protein
MAITIFIWFPSFVTLGTGPTLLDADHQMGSDQSSTFKGRASFEAAFKLLKSKDLKIQPQK